MTVKQQQSFSPYAFYVRITVIATYATALSGAPLITLGLSLSGYLYDFLKYAKNVRLRKIKGNNEGRERGCRQSLYRCTKNFRQRRWKTYTRYLTLTQNIHLVLCNTPKTLEPQ